MVHMPLLQCRSFPKHTRHSANEHTTLTITYTRTQNTQTHSTISQQERTDAKCCAPRKCTMYSQQFCLHAATCAHCSHKQRGQTAVLGWLLETFCYDFNEVLLFSESRTCSTRLGSQSNQSQLGISNCTPDQTPDQAPRLQS